MSLLFKTGVEEYARQCTVQRRHYEDCRHQTRNSESPGDATQTWTIAQTIAVKEAAQANNVDHCTERSTQSCMIDLFELPVDPLAWEEQDSVVDEMEMTEFEAYQWQDDAPSTFHQAVGHPTGKGSCSMSYGAP